MAIIKACDGNCGKQSPDAERHHPANHWIYTHTEQRVRGYKRNKEYLFCKECWEKMLKAVAR